MSARLESLLDPARKAQADAHDVVIPAHRFTLTPAAAHSALTEALMQFKEAMPTPIVIVRNPDGEDCTAEDRADFAADGGDPLGEAWIESALNCLQDAQRMAKKHNDCLRSGEEPEAADYLKRFRALVVEAVDDLAGVDLGRNAVTRWTRVS